MIYKEREQPLWRFVSLKTPACADRHRNTLTHWKCPSRICESRDTKHKCADTVNVGQFNSKRLYWHNLRKCTVLSSGTGNVGEIIITVLKRIFFDIHNIAY